MLLTLRHASDTVLWFRGVLAGFILFSVQNELLKFKIEKVRVGEND